MYLLFCRLPINLHCIWAFPFFTFFLSFGFALIFVSLQFGLYHRCMMQSSRNAIHCCFLGVGGTQYYSLKECMICIDHDLWLIMIAQEINCSIQNNHLKKSYAEPLSEKKHKIHFISLFHPFHEICKKSLIMVSRCHFRAISAFHIQNFPFLFFSIYFPFWHVCFQRINDCRKPHER